MPLTTCLLVASTLLAPGFGGQQSVEPDVSRKVGFYKVPKDSFEKLPLKGGTFIIKTPEEVVPALDLAKKHNMRLLLHLTGGRQLFSDKNAAFSMDLFKKRLERFKDVDFRPYVESGTVIGHILFDEPHDKTNWDGRQVTPEQVDEAARLSKEILPGLPTAIGSPPTYFRGHTMKYLDLASAAFVNKKGTFDEWLSEQISASKETNLKVVVTINVLLHYGKNQRKDGSAPTLEANKLLAYGMQAASDPTVAAVTFWKFEDEYASNPAIQTTLTNLSKVKERKPG